MYLPISILLTSVSSYAMILTNAHTLSERKGTLPLVVFIMCLYALYEEKIKKLFVVSPRLINP